MTSPGEKEKKAFRLAIRQALLSMVDALERLDQISPRTAEIRKNLKMLMLEKYEGWQSDLTDSKRTYKKRPK